MADSKKLLEAAKKNDFEGFKKEFFGPNKDLKNLSTQETEAASIQFNSYKQQSDSSGINSKPPTTSGGGGSIASGVAGIQSFTSTYTNPVDPLITPEKVADFATQLGAAFFGKQGGFVEGLKSGFSMIITEVMKGGEDILRKEVELRNKLNSQIGIAGELSRGYRDNIIASSDAVAGMGYKMDDLIDTSIAATEATGRFFTMSEKTMENMSVTSRSFIGDMRLMGPLLRNFELVGVGADKTLENINEAGKRALTLGLNTRTTTAELSKNIGKLNEYGFQNGIQGLASMVRKATEFRMEMGEVFKVADKVMSPEGALDLAANLQVLGGAIGALGDPFQMMYMATNNVEGLQEALIGASESLATYNAEQGRFEITGVNLRRAKAMAQELGISYTELANGAIAAAERTSAAADLMAAGITVDDKEKEFITNLAKMGSGGRMVIDVPPSLAKELGVDRELALEDLDQVTANAILQNQKQFEKMDVKDIALEQFTETQKMALNISEIAQMLKVMFAEEYRTYGSKIDEYIKAGNDLLNQVKEGKGDNELTKEVNKLKSENIRAGRETGEKEKARLEKQTPTKVDNSQQNTQQKENTTNPNDKPISAADMERIMKEARTASKYDDKGQIVVYNNIDTTTQGSYLVV